MWKEGEQQYKYLAPRNLDCIAPAGAITTNVHEMAQWLRLQLGRGVYNGERLISEEQLTETWKPQRNMVEGMDYGLGWMLHEYKGLKVVEHGGNIDGFAAKVAMIPEKNLGYVLLTNVTATPLQKTSESLVWKHILGGSSEEAVQAESNL